MRILVSILLLLLGLVCTNSQVNSQQVLKNGLYAEVSFAPVIINLNIVVNYERLLELGEKQNLLGVRLGVGRYLGGSMQSEENGWGTVISINPLIGNGKSFFESNLGLGMVHVAYCANAFDDDNLCPERRFWPVVHAGYRYQSKVIFRCYIGSLNGVSIGVNF